MYVYFSLEEGGVKYFGPAYKRVKRVKRGEENKQSTHAYAFLVRELRNVASCVSSRLDYTCSRITPKFFGAEEKRAGMYVNRYPRRKRTTIYTTR